MAKKKSTDGKKQLPNTPQGRTVGDGDGISFLSTDDMAQGKTLSPEVSGGGGMTTYNESVIDKIIDSME